MGRITAFVGALVLALSAGTSVAAAETASADETLHQIAVVNDYDAPIAVYVEDAEGALHELVTLKAGEVRLVDTEIVVADGAELRLHARPTDSSTRWSTWGDQGIVTEALELSESETAVFFIMPDLAKSLVEIRGM